MKKIMFSDKLGLTAAVLQGRKTMTRRFEKGLENLVEGNFYFNRKANEINLYGEKGSVVEKIKSHYELGEVVAVAQSYKSIHEEMANGDYGNSRYDAFRCAMVAGTKGWNNKQNVKSGLMPHQIRITDIKVERLQNISEEDCLKEGIQEYFPYIDRNPNDKVRTFRYFKDGKIRHCISPASKCFSYLIDDVSGKGTWESNPYVFVYIFEKVK